jgi:hypothetical protein
VLGAAGLALAGTQLLNGDGQLVGALQNAAGSLKLNPSGYSKLPSTQVGDYVPDSIDLSEVGSMSAKLAEFLSAKV